MLYHNAQSLRPPRVEKAQKEAVTPNSLTLTICILAQIGTASTVATAAGTKRNEERWGKNFHS